MPRPTDKPAPDAPVEDVTPSDEDVVLDPKKSEPKPTGGFTRPA